MIIINNGGKVKMKKKERKALKKSPTTEFMNPPGIAPDGTVAAKPMQRCVRFKNPMMVLEHEYAENMVNSLNLDIVSAKRAEDGGFDMYTVPLSTNNPYLNNIYTGISALEMTEDGKRGTELALLNAADQNVSLRYSKEKRCNMILNITDLINTNYRAIISHATKTIMDYLIFAIGEVGAKFPEDRKYDLYDSERYIYVFSTSDIDMVDLDMWQLLQRSNELWEAENPSDPENKAVRQTVDASMDLSYGVLYQIIMQAICTSYTNIVDNIRRGVYIYMKDDIDIAQADLVYRNVMDYANDLMCNYGEVIFQNLYKVCEALPAIQESYYRRNLNNWDQEKFGLNIEDGMPNGSSEDAPKIGIF
jgi:hypothetical protein